MTLEQTLELPSLRVPEAITERSKLHLTKIYDPIRPLAIELLQSFFEKTERILQITESFRSMQDQLDAYNKGRMFDGKKWVIVNAGQVVTNARPGFSWHCYGLAFDCAFQGQDPYLSRETPETRTRLWNTYGDLGKSLKMKWGGDFRLVNGVSDLPHFEQPYGLRLDQALELYQQGGLNHVWGYLSQN